ncbi:unnamed protein product [Cuscuta epithymum]|uniref:Thioredoxin domain-containing protein n=1 Tax=Cuscuta epithymum TaxID=186058 RepID=A0AAV0EN07_9ASTE|nr:unnamed protein product [Cuscuta epithymum]
MGGLLSALTGEAEAAEAPTTESSSPSRVIVFESSHAWKQHFNAAKELNKLMVVDFTASWCGPCKFMAPFIDTMASKYTDVNFIKIDVDEVKEAAEEYGVTAMPTFVFIKQGKVVDKVVGANKGELEEKILKHKPREVPKFAA